MIHHLLHQIQKKNTNHHKVLAHTQKKENPQESTKINDELSVYYQIRCTCWEEVKTVFPALYKQATRHFCIVAPSVPAERLFSKPGSTITQRRNRLSEKVLEKLLFVSDSTEDE